MKRLVRVVLGIGFLMLAAYMVISIHQQPIVFEKWVTVDYGTSYGKLVNAEIFSKSFAQLELMEEKDPDVTLDRPFYFIRFKKPMETIQVLEWMSTNGYTPANAKELLAFASRRVPGADDLGVRFVSGVLVREKKSPTPTYLRITCVMVVASEVQSVLSDEGQYRIDLVPELSYHPSYGYNVVFMAKKKPEIPK